jgi:hypothetical protein
VGKGLKLGALGETPPQVISQSNQEKVFNRAPSLTQIQDRAPRNEPIVSTMRVFCFLQKKMDEKQVGRPREIWEPELKTFLSPLTQGL